MKILIIGSGSFVFEDVYGPGVVLRSVVQWIAEEQSGQAFTIVLSYHSPEKLTKKC